MNSVEIPDDTDAEPDALLVEFARRGNRAAILEEVYRRAHGYTNGYDIAAADGVDTDDISSTADAVWDAYRADGVDTDRMFILSLAYDDVADHVFQHLEDDQ